MRTWLLWDTGQAIAGR